MEKFYYKSPIGILEIVCKNETLISLKLVEKSAKSDKQSHFINRIVNQLDEYFSGKRKVFDIKIDLKGTDFQKKVWAELLKIPFGETKSYSQIATALKNVNAQRAVGSACKENPVIIIVPCHRVISKNGNIGGFAYGVGIKTKLLEFEKN